VRVAVTLGPFADPNWFTQREALAEIHRHVHPCGLLCIHHGIVRLVRLHDRSIRNAHARYERSPVRTERYLAHIRGAHDGGVRGVGDVSCAQTNGAARVGGLCVSAVGGDEDLRIRANTNDR
jgi:hypothetical protein